MKKWKEELLKTKLKYELKFKEIMTDEYNKRQATYFFENGFGISISFNPYSNGSSFFIYPL